MTPPIPDPRATRDALRGVRVVALEQAVALPFCSHILAEMGADVVKIERVGSGDLIRTWDHAVGGLSTGFVWLNANKRDLAVDMAQPEGREIIERLVETSDVFVENFAPGAVDRLGLGYEAMRALNPRLIYASLSGYGQDGPYRENKAYDLLIQGESGILLTNGYPDAPAKVALPITDLIGGMTAALGVIAALRCRDASGNGEYIDVSMLDAATSWLGYFPQHIWHGGGEPPRTGMHHQYICPYGPYLASDDRYVNIVVASPSDWERFVTEVVRRPEWLSDPRFSDNVARVENRETLSAAVSAVIATEEADVWLERLRASRLACGEVRTIAEVVEHPQLVARDMFVTGTSPVGEVPLVRFPFGRPDVERRVPSLGEHTEAILGELGFAADERADLVSRGIVGI